MRTETQETSCRRAEPRSALHCMALAFRRDGTRSVVQIADMSLSGLRISGASFAADDEFRLVIPHRGDVDARVRWASDDTAGGRFDEDVVLNDVVPASEAYAIGRVRAFNFGSGRVFGTRRVSAS